MITVAQAEIRERLADRVQCYATESAADRIRLAKHSALPAVLRDVAARIPVWWSKQGSSNASQLVDDLRRFAASLEADE